MTYKDCLVAEIKLNGKILRLKDDTAYLPFGSEYSLLLKNLNTRRASIKIEIDGQDVLDNSSLVIDPNSTTEITGFLKGSTARNRFKFIQKTKQIQDHRGDKIEEVLIRIEFAFDKTVSSPWITTVINEVNELHDPPFKFTHYGSGSNWTYSASVGIPAKGDRDIQSFNCNVEDLAVTPAQNEGITVKGSEINQNFNYTSMGELEDSKVIIIKLCGLTQQGTNVTQAKTTQEKLTCSVCGTKSKSSAKYCSNCGTFLE